MLAAKRERDTTVTIKDANGEEIASFTVPQTFGAIAFSDLGLEDGTYYAYVSVG